jgi:hypothetical protein
MHSVCDTYLCTIHTWLPIFSRKRLYSKVNDFNAEVDISLALLLLCMKLVSEVVPSGQREAATSSLYCIAKEFYFKLETSCLISLQLLQSAILISVYEIGHGIYPAAYLSIGNAARLGFMIGLHDKANAAQLFKEADTWSLCEEERRAWWAVILLER